MTKNIMRETSVVFLINLSITNHDEKNTVLKTRSKKRENQQFGPWTLS